MALSVPSLSLHSLSSLSSPKPSTKTLTFNGRFCPSIRHNHHSIQTLTTTKAAEREVDTSSPAPDLASHLLKNRIVYLGMPLSKSVIELMIAQFVSLQRLDPLKPINFYINSTGVVQNDERLGYETEAFSLYDLLSTLKPPIFTLCVGNAWGEAAMLLAAGERGNRAVLPSASIMIKEPLCRFQGPAADAVIAREEMRIMKEGMVNLLAKHTGQTKERILEDMKRRKYFTAEEALEYGFVDKVLHEEGQETNGIFSILNRALLK